MQGGAIEVADMKYPNKNNYIIYTAVLQEYFEDIFIFYDITKK